LTESKLGFYLLFGASTAASCLFIWVCALIHVVSHLMNW